MTATEMNRAYSLSTSDISQRLDVHPKTVARWAAEGRLPHIRLGGKRGPLRFSEDGYRQLVESFQDNAAE